MWPYGGQRSIDVLLRAHGARDTTTHATHKHTQHRLFLTPQRDNSVKVQCAMFLQYSIDTPWKQLPLFPLPIASIASMFSMHFVLLHRFDVTSQHLRRNTVAIIAITAIRLMFAEIAVIDSNCCNVCGLAFSAPSGSPANLTSSAMKRCPASPAKEESSKETKEETKETKETKEESSPGAADSATATTTSVKSKRPQKIRRIAFAKDKCIACERDVFWTPKLARTHDGCPFCGH